MEAYEFRAWLQAVVRWVHVFSAILWIGQTYLFNFLERNLERDRDTAHRIGDLWMVHGGGFYRVEKLRFHQPLPRMLHWFKWEAAATWLSGAVLIALTYYMGGLLVEPEASYLTAALAGIGAIVLSWPLYDALVRSPLGRREVVLAVVGLGLVLGLHHGLSQVLSARAAMIHIGAVLGTLMAANVWMRILPAQRRMLAATAAGEALDPALTAVGPQRSKHNSYMVVPLIFLMISSHYPIITYGHSHSTWVLGAILVVGGVIARVLRG